jgi:hypothetical protein
VTANSDAPLAHDDAQVDSKMVDAPSGPMPLVQWQFEGNTNNTGSISGYALMTPAGASYTTGKVGMAISFGAGQYANLTTGMRLLLGSLPKVTIAFWLKEPGTLNSAAVFDVINRTTSPYGGVQLGFASNMSSLCVSTTTNMLLTAGCGGATTPLANAWHHWIIRYNGTSTATGGGGPTEIYVDGVLAFTRMNDTANNPVFTSTGIPDGLSVGASNTMLDDLRIYNSTYDLATQCTAIIGGAWTGTACTLP